MSGSYERCEIPLPMAESRRIVSGGAETRDGMSRAHLVIAGLDRAASHSASGDQTSNRYTTLGSSSTSRLITSFVWHCRNSIARRSKSSSRYREPFGSSSFDAQYGGNKPRPNVGCESRDWADLGSAAQCKCVMTKFFITIMKRPRLPAMRVTATNRAPRNSAARPLDHPWISSNSTATPNAMFAAAVREAPSRRVAISTRTGM